MAQIPQTVLDRSPLVKGLPLRGRGKVRDSYGLPNFPQLMVPFASDRVSIFDFVLPALVPQKGYVLNALSHFWVKHVIKDLVQTDLVVAGAGIDEYLPAELRGDVDLQKSASVVNLFPAPEFEGIIRIILTGSGWESYQKSGEVCGLRLPAGLTNGSMLPFPIFTPTTKAAIGHDEHVTTDSIAVKYGVLPERLSLQVAQLINSYALKRGILLADTKFEWSFFDGRPVLVDEKATPDSSRYFDYLAYLEAQKKGKLPSPFDKQLVRNFGITLGVNQRNPENPDDLAYVHSLVVPEDLIKRTTAIYRYIFWRLTGMMLEQYQKLCMGINVEVPRRRIEIVIGSESDKPQMIAGIHELHGRADVRVHVVSCHRNPWELKQFTDTTLSKADCVIAGAGKAAALPGIVKSWLVANDSSVPVIGVAFEGISEADNIAARTSIECLPGQPVELDSKGNAYFGSKGFVSACYAAVYDEFLLKMPESKPVQYDITI